jgi:transcriptional regulator GlxA family with amidase domain
MLYILVSSLTSALMSQDVYSIRCAREDSETLVTLLKRELRQDTNERSSSRMKRLTDLIDSIRKQPAGKWDSPTIARMVHMSQRNLNRTFHRVFNMPPAKMVTSIRMDIAARMLIESDMPLRAIASAVGYDSSFSFSRLFKKHAEISPAHYRELRRNQK